ncbi:hypothetical protein [Brevibacillus migulae]|uniref:hypothetical protein n=1 Tax=Brevibacillus migulae TaxID=1644114 RepID=UPI00106F0470|nr:hypothetical protein [Brevibacillus migulae]
MIDKLVYLITVNVLILFFFYLIEGSRVTDGFLIKSATLAIGSLSVIGFHILFQKRGYPYQAKMVIAFVSFYLLCSILAMLEVGRPQWAVGVTVLQRIEWFVRDGLSLAFIDLDAIKVFFLKWFASMIAAFVLVRKTSGSSR